MIKFKSARHALTQAFAFGWQSSANTMELMTTVQTSQQSNIDSIINGTLCSVIIGEVEKLPSAQKAWIKLAYGPWSEKDHPGCVFAWIVERWLAQRFWCKPVAKRFSNRRRTDILLSMCKPALREHIHRSRTATVLLTNIDVQSQSGATSKDIKNWTRDFSPQYQKMLTILNGLDKVALKPIVAKVNEINADLGVDSVS